MNKCKNYQRVLKPIQELSLVTMVEEVSPEYNVILRGRNRREWKNMPDYLERDYFDGLWQGISFSPFPTSSEELHPLDDRTAMVFKNILKNR